MRYNRLKPYMRRMQRGDYSIKHDIICNAMLSAAWIRGRQYYVLAVHGIPHGVITLSTMKIGIKDAIEELNHGHSFKQWCRDMRQQNKELGF